MSGVRKLHAFFKIINSIHQHYYHGFIKLSKQNAMHVHVDFIVLHLYMYVHVILKKFYIKFLF